MSFNATSLHQITSSEYVSGFPDQLEGGKGRWGDHSARYGAPDASKGRKIAQAAIAVILALAFVACLIAGGVVGFTPLIVGLAVTCSVLEVINWIVMGILNGSGR